MSYTLNLPVSRSFSATVNGSLYVAGTRTFNGVQKGTKVDNWRSKIAEGQQAGSAFELNRYDIELWQPGQISLTARRVSDGQKGTQSAFGIYLPVEQVPHLSSNTVNVEAQALTKVLKKIKETQSQLNGWTVLGELRETIGMLRNPASSLRSQIDKYLTLLRKRKQGIRIPPGSDKHRRALQDILSGTWLEVQFGWLPVIADTKDILAAIGRLTDGFPEKKAAGGEAHERLSYHEVGTPVILTPHMLVVQYNNIMESDLFCKYRCGLVSHISGPTGAAEELRKVLGFTPSNFVPALWEILPWSWLVDYFTNVGDIVEASFADTRDVTWITKSAGVRSTATQWWQQQSSKAILAANGWTETGNSGGDLGQSRVSRMSFTRTLPQTLGVPSFVVSTPSSPKKMLNILAVFAQQALGFSGRNQRVMALTRA
jgi:hypothetical protein